MELDLKHIIETQKSREELEEFIERLYKSITVVPDDMARDTCQNCLKDIKNYPRFNFKINDLGYGSVFDSMDTEVNLCIDCYEKTNKKIWTKDLEGIESFGEMFYRLKYEDEILEYIEQMAIPGMELFYNRLNTRNRIYIKPDMWIDSEIEHILTRDDSE